MNGGGFNPAPATAPLIDQLRCLRVDCSGGESVGALRDDPRQIACDGERYCQEDCLWALGSNVCSDDDDNDVVVVVGDASSG